MPAHYISLTTSGHFSAAAQLTAIYCRTAFCPACLIGGISQAHERHRILGEIPLRKFGAGGAPVLDPDGNPDTSFVAKIPADTPFTFQMLDKDGLVLTMAQTWHQVRPGEVRTNCGGCHAHSQTPLDIASTYAGNPANPVTDLTRFVTLLSKYGAGETIVQTRTTPGAANVEFLRDIRPVLQRSCTPCHSSSTTPAVNASLVLDDYALYNSVPGDYARLADDDSATWGYKPVIPSRIWRQTNASRYVRMFQSRRSLLIWKIFGRRLDGWTNADHPTESVPGDPATLPPGANVDLADLDYAGTIMPPPGSGVPPLTDDEKMNFARWVDLGCPINSGELAGGTNGNFGWFLDDLRPTLTVSSPRQNRNEPPLTELRVGFADAYSGISGGTLSVKTDFVVNGQPAGTELAGLGTVNNEGIWTLPLTPPLLDLAPSHLTASVSDVQGNRTTIKVRFRVAAPGLRILSVNGAQLNQGRFTIQFENPDGTADHTLLGSDDLSPAALWAPLAPVNSIAAPGGSRSLEVQLPAGLPRYFFRVRQPW